MISNTLLVLIAVFQAARWTESKSEDCCEMIAWPCGCLVEDEDQGLRGSGMIGWTRFIRKAHWVVL